MEFYSISGLILILGISIAFPLMRAVKKPTGLKTAIGKFLGSSLSQ
jgi:hypothetical protein